MKIKLLYSFCDRGPGVVAKNCCIGLKNLGIELVGIKEKADKTICLQDPKNFNIDYSEINLVGPNVMFSKENSKNFENFLVPSNWVYDLFKRYEFMNEKKIHIWPTGIDTDFWSPQDSNYEFDCLIYYKNANEKYLKEAIKLCNNHNFTFNVISYNSYSEDDLLFLSRKSRFSINVTKTESQGMAYMQMLSTNLPAFIFDKEIWDDNNEYNYKSCIATSAPYFDENCGVKISQTSSFEEKDEKFNTFLKNISSYNPRDYVLYEHTLNKSAIKLLSFLE